MDLLDELKKEAEELKGQIEGLKKDLADLDFYKVKTAIAQEIGCAFVANAGVKVVETPKFVGRDENKEVSDNDIAKAIAVIAAINDELIRLGIAAATGLTSQNDCGLTCCPDDNPRPYKEKMKKLSLAGLVIHRDNSYHIPSDRFSAAQDTLIASLGSNEQRTRLNSLQSQKTVTEEKLKAAEKKAADVATQIRIEESLKGQTVSLDTRAYLATVSASDLKVVDPDTLVFLGSRSEWGSSGGIGYFAQVTAYYRGQTDMQEWQWRDRYSASKDKPWLSVHGIGRVTASEKDGKVQLEVELVNNQHGNRKTSFTFNKAKELPTVKRLPAKDQEIFAANVEKEIARVLEELERLWGYKPQMAASYPAGMSMPMGTPSYVSYQQPMVKERKIRADIGMAAFVTVEQIDHRGSDPQIRFELHVMKFGEEKSRSLCEDHGYGSEGGAFLVIQDINQEAITVNSKAGKQVIKMN